MSGAQGLRRLLWLSWSCTLPRCDGTQHLRQLPPAAQRGELGTSWHHLRNSQRSKQNEPTVQDCLRVSVETCVQTTRLYTVRILPNECCLSIYLYIYIYIYIYILYIYIWLVVSTPLKNITVYCRLCAGTEAASSPCTPPLRANSRSMPERGDTFHVSLRHQLTSKYLKKMIVNCFHLTIRPIEIIGSDPPPQSQTIGPSQLTRYHNAMKTEESSPK